VALYGDGPIGAPHAVDLSGRALPGSLIVLPPSATTADFRMRVDGVDTDGSLGSQAAGDTPVRAGAIPRYALTLGAGPLPDADGDGVPDAIDDCADTPDPLQDCASPSDAGVPPDQAAPDLASMACPQNALLCEDWEGGAFGSWGTQSGGPVPATLAVDGTMAHTGRFALHGQAPALGPGNDSQAAAARGFTAISSGFFAVRTYLYTEVLPAEFDLYFTIADGAGRYYSVGGATNTAPGNWVVTHPGLGPDVYGPTVVPLGRWVCVELQLLLIGAGPSGHLALLVDGVPVIDQNYDTSGVTGGLQQIVIGVDRDTGEHAVSEWFDDLVISNAPIGCN
jgi:hypothetical protein